MFLVVACLLQPWGREAGAGAQPGCPLTHAGMLRVSPRELSQAGIVVLGQREVVAWPGPEDPVLVREGPLFLRCVLGDCGCRTTGLGPTTTCPAPQRTVEGQLWRGEVAPGRYRGARVSHREGTRMALCVGPLASPSLPLPARR